MSDDPVSYLPDVNVLVALSLTTHQHHRAAHDFLAGISGTWATCPLTETALLRLLLNPAVTGPTASAPARSSSARRVLDGLSSDPRWRFVPDDTSLSRPRVETTVLLGHNQVTDLHLVNLAARHGLQLATFDARLATWLAPADRRHVTVVPA